MARELITANMLEQWAQAGRPIVIPRDALITPAAQDWLRRANVPVTRESEAGGAAKTSYGLAAEFDQPMIRSTAAAIEEAAGPYRRFEMASGAGKESLIAAVELCAAVAANQIERGIVLTNHPDSACVLANKLPNVRAMVGGGWRSVESACQTIGINVLIIPPGLRSFHEIKQMVGRFLKCERRTLPALERAIAAAERKRLGADR
jgi:ribose 5-phosphate isomerase RpiB